jgi:IclR family transcriptional regulator, pca regulon regulatory protein
MPISSVPDIDRKMLVEGLGKGLRVLESFSEECPRMTATEAGARAGLTRTAAKRYLMSLVHHGYAQTDGKHYWLSARVLRIGQGYLESSRLPRLAQPFLQRFSLQTGETANLSVLDEHEVVYLYRSNSPGGLSIGYPTGARIPAHCTSAGHVMLSFLDSPLLEEWGAAHDFSRFTPQTVTDREAFLALVTEARKKRYSVVNQFANVGLSGMAVPLIDRKGRCLGALSTTYQNVAYPEDSALRKLLPALQETADLMRSAV